MPLVQARCTSCGGTLQVDDAKVSAICPYCGTSYIVQEAINNYVTYQTTNIAHADVVHVQDDHSAQARLKAGDTLLRLEQYEKARTAYEEASLLAPHDYRSWWGQVKADLMAGKLVSKYDKRYQSAVATAPAALVYQLEDEFQRLSSPLLEAEMEKSQIQIEADQLLAQIPALKKDLADRRSKCAPNYSENTSASSDSFLGWLCRAVRIFFILMFIGSVIWVIYDAEQRITYLISAVVSLALIFSLSALAAAFDKARRNSPYMKEQAAIRERRKNWFVCFNDAMKELEEAADFLDRKRYDYIGVLRVAVIEARNCVAKAEKAIRDFDSPEKK